MKKIASILFLVISLSVFSQNQITKEDLSKIIGGWEGEITYIDYQSNKPFTMTANLEVEQGKKETQLILNNIYPKEPKANNSEKIKVTKKGTMLNKHAVTKREKLVDGQVEIQTEHEGKDDNKKALIRQTYVISQDAFLIRKEVQFNPNDDWIKRSEFNYKRKK